MDAVSDAARESPDSERGAESEAKRRKVRKGTRSCWECKRRKIRCSFSTASDSVCIGCRRRGTSCVTQEYPEETAAAALSTGDRGRSMGDRIVRVEALVEQLVKQVGNRNNGSTARAGSSALSEDGGPNTGIPTPGSSDRAESARFLTAYEPSGPDLGLESSHLEGLFSSPMMRTPDSPPPPTTIAPSRGIRYEQVSATLHAALPPREDIHLMIKAGIDVSLHKLTTHPYPVLAQNPGGGKGDLAEIPEAKTHPALLAKYLLILATCLQFVHPELHAEEIHDLSEPPRLLMRRLADTAISLVTSNDEFLGSVEGLECVMLESIYEANSGNLRRAWFACRRAMVVAQMMGIHRSGIQQPLKVISLSKPVYPSYIWYRIVATDRQLCLMLGLPQGSVDVSMASEAALACDTPSGRFERKQCVIASRILERNEWSDPAIADSFAALQELDAELQRAANEMPSIWWLVPNLASLVHDPEKTFWETLRLLEQMLYFNLLNLLHLPYMLRSSTPDTDQVGNGGANYKYEYSKLTSVNASRELLTRFIMFRSFNRVAFCCRSVDFFALTAAMTLVIAHLDGHRKQRQRQHSAGIGGINVLAHHRNGDRAMMERVLENMEAVAKLSTDVLSERSSSLLRSLLALEADAAEGRHGNVDRDCFAAAADDGQSLRIGIPYFGTIRIDREGVISMDAPRRATPPSPAQQRHMPTETVVSSPAIRASEDGYTAGQASGRLGVDILPPAQPPFDDVASEMPSIPQQPQQVAQASSPAAAQLPRMQAHQPFAPQFPTAIDDALQQEYLYPGLTAVADDWAFQGVDLAFFDSLTRGSGVECAGDGSGSWVNLEGGS
ncbi:hypothetical protein BDY21DRAFT_328633 [Lineolata rhizophorae]|uniref:Zn(2)-C6 fungal-type domain-containing protein n=1 Tax=Lineolata rhizophorae TaxID=578093 RepID=A0A6A6NMB9_9PEZI|nr:hypothetical protein BDY21DRAFT_328633 [Lineolata rhizophorae]